MAFVVDIDLKGVKPLLKALQSFPAAMRSKILVPVANKAGRTIAKAIAVRVPYQLKKKKRQRPHYRDVVQHVVREYPTTQSVSTIVGAESGKAPHATIVELGTGPRFTNHKTKYVRTGTKARVIIKNGRPKWIVEKSRRSVGSFMKRKSKKAQIAFNLGVTRRGRMPAFHPIKRGVDATKSQVAADLQAGIKAGITREFTQAQMSRGL